MLTDTQCRNAKPKDKPYKLLDGKGLYLEVKPNGVKAWRYRFELREAGVAKESLFAVGDYIVAPRGETPEEAQARRAGGSFTLAEARDERAKARTGRAGHQPGPQAAAGPHQAETGKCNHLRGGGERMSGSEGLGGHDQGPSTRHAYARRIPKIYASKSY